MPPPSALGLARKSGTGSPSAGSTGFGREDETAAGYPQKKFFRSRAHCNPLSNNDGFEYPVAPEASDAWAEVFPAHGRDAGALVRHLDVGCGFGGLSVALARLSPELTLALEIRPKVCEFVRQRIEALLDPGAPFLERD